MKRFLLYILALSLSISLISCDSGPQSPTGLKALIIDGQNNHDMWPKTTIMMKSYLEETGMYSQVDIVRTATTWKGEDYLEQYAVAGIATEAREKPEPDPNYTPDFSAYDVIINNFGWMAADWPAATQTALEDYLKGGGGMVVVHAADNSFPAWREYNKMIGIGGWGGRTEKDGPYVYYTDEGTMTYDKTDGRAGSHGPQHEFQVTIRKGHPITKDMPATWLHAKDELYDRLRGPAGNMSILATAYSDTTYKGTGRHEPMLIALSYGEGRVFHTPMGHADYSMECVGFITTLKRGAEWAATGQVTQKIPEDFPTAAESRSRKFVD